MIEKKKPQTAKRKSKKISLSAIWKNKRVRPILLLGAAVLLCLLVYLVLLFTVLRPDDQEQTPTIGNHGEEMFNGRPFVVDPIESSQITAIKVENDKGGFRYYRGEDDIFYFEDAEFMLYDVTSDWMNTSSEDVEDVLQGVSMTYSLVNHVCYLLSTEEVVGYNPDLSVYGLDGNGKASMTLCYLDAEGKEISQTLIYGNKTISGSSYYVRLEGRDAVYILADTYITRCIFADVKDYFLPQVAPSISTAAYSEVSEFKIRKDGKDFASIRKLSDEEYEQNGEIYTHIFTNPDGYYPSVDDFNTILETFISFSGEQVVEYDITSRLSDPTKNQELLDMFRLYSLINPNGKWNYELYYSYENLKFDVTLYISEKLEVQGEGEDSRYIYYIYSPAFDCIVEFSAEDLPWIEWDLLKLMDNHAFSISIDKVSTIELSYGETKAKYTLQGDGADLKVTSSNGVNVVTDNFRQLYKAILFARVEGYAEQPENSTHILSMKITLRNGVEYDYTFYGLTARKAYYSLNGSGEFFVNRDYVKQIISACDGILKGETVTVERKY